ncbi:glycoside hydrolase family 2 TIM barrel-domain containing protein [Mucilaginibacter sp. OK283]|uniref:glycoside hydrolase family 2 TIM barrel-domain containing protein n=1 Tax=Mucilaginibacter sp. OK283 TaxID=1881049 RepID=UPI0008C03D32|nr:glycoside hydrolase family 2 TIM barrel-domain containing protein [Mucilaginibacter sp. OK283]SEO38440.1 Glycosyl hydrolases family 2, TIM barrel domain [Mucilaginibacter sp. OK283]
MIFYSFRLVVIHLILLSCFFSFGCNKAQPADNAGKTVYIKNENGKYTLYRQGQPFLVKGAAGHTNLKRLKEAGGNTIRVWDTVHLANILDSAQANNLAVIVGLPMPPSLRMDEFYNTPQAAAFTKKITSVINKYKNHPALLCWCLGNELTFPFRPRFNQFYTVFNNLVDSIHYNDPQHPVTTTVMTFQKENIFNIRYRTKIDFISFNIFGSIQTLKQDLQDFKWLWNGPFLITEWSVEGPWVAASQNVWGAYVENTSTKKAEQYLATYSNYMPVDNPRFLGSMVFYWGQKQELTPTWFSLFDEHGGQTEIVNAMQYLWTGKKPPVKAPDIKYMLVENKGGRDNILLSPKTTSFAIAYMNEPGTAKLTYKWQLFAEDWFKPNGIFNDKPLKDIKNAVTENNGPIIKFKVPETEGPYRLYVYVYNDNGYFATANVPFYVLYNP